MILDIYEMNGIFLDIYEFDLELKVVPPLVQNINNHKRQGVVTFPSHILPTIDLGDTCPCLILFYKMNKWIYH